MKLWPLRSRSQAFHLYLIFTKTEAHGLFDTSSYLAIKRYQLLPLFPFWLLVKKMLSCSVVYISNNPKDSSLPFVIPTTALQRINNALFLLSLLVLFNLLWIFSKFSARLYLDISLWNTLCKRLSNSDSLAVHSLTIYCFKPLIGLITWSLHWAF